MAYSSYAWSKPSEPTPAVPLVPGVDPEHLNPTPNLDYDDQQWKSSVNAPVFADGIYVDPAAGGGMPSGYGPVDMTPGQTVNTLGEYGVPPERSQHGVGVGPGITQGEASEIRGRLQSEDLGAVAAHQYHPLTDRFDGDGPHVALIDDTPGDGDSPATLQYQRTGVGQPNDPYARTGKRTSRWWDRVWDMHWFDVEMRPMTVKNAYTAQAQPAVVGGTQLDSPYPTSATGYATFQSPDNFVNPQLRRSPDQWGQPLTSDGVSVAAEQISSWGL